MLENNPRMPGTKIAEQFVKKYPEASERSISEILREFDPGKSALENAENLTRKRGKQKRKIEKPEIHAFEKAKNPWNIEFFILRELTHTPGITNVRVIQNLAEIGLMKPDTGPESVVNMTRKGALANRHLGVKPATPGRNVPDLKERVKLYRNHLETLKEVESIMHTITRKHDSVSSPAQSETRKQLHISLQMIQTTYNRMKAGLTKHGKKLQAEIEEAKKNPKKAVSKQ